MNHKLLDKINSQKIQLQQHQIILARAMRDNNQKLVAHIEGEITRFQSNIIFLEGQFYAHRPQI